jgi:hypothetical protein
VTGTSLRSARPSQCTGIFKTLHILSYIDTGETYRRDIKGIRNLQGGLENPLGALGLVLNRVVLWTTVYLGAAPGPRCHPRAPQPRRPRGG